MNEPIDRLRAMLLDRYPHDPDLVQLLEYVGQLQTALAYWQEEATTSSIEEFPNEDPTV